MEALETVDVQSIVVETVSKVFDTMLTMDMDFIESMSQSYLYGNRILGSINLMGRVMGIVNVQVGSDFAQAMTAAMLGLEPEETGDDEAVKDVVGEVCNMISGGIKSALCDAGLDCELSTPGLTRGKDYRLDSSPMTRREYYTFYHGDHLMLVDVGLKLSDGEGIEEGNGEAVADASGGQVMNFDVGGSVCAAVRDVFDTMLDMDVQPGSGLPEPGGGQGRIVGSISLTGCVGGRVNVEVTEPFSRRMAGAMLDLEQDEIDDPEGVRDVIGEVCNMISGALKSDLCDAGLTCRLSPPSFTSGVDFQMESLFLSRQERFVFYQGPNPIVVEVGLRATDPSA
ncbi:MAG: chemotaxis protein CheX [Desulfobacterales bacterium]|nr:chemotaxis protein CheX [Desulfobacterales bacterium]